MIRLEECMEIGCATSLMKKHRDHIKEENKKNKDIKHQCTDTCQIVERQAHQDLHKWYQSKK